MDSQYFADTGCRVLPRPGAGCGFCASRRRTFLRPTSDTITVALRLAPATETVNVSATRTLVPANVAGADVESLNAGQLEVMRPVAADDALHFLPGAVVSTAGTARRTCRRCSCAAATPLTTK